MKEDSGAEPDDRTPYERFEDLAKRVFTVPKQEIDKRLQDHKDKRKKNRTNAPKKKG